MTRKHRTIASLIVIAIALMTLAPSCYDFLKPVKGADDQKKVDEFFDGLQDDDQQPDDDQSETDQTTADQGDADVDKPPVPFTELYNNPHLGPLDWFFEALYPTATNDDRAKVVFEVDPNTGQLIYSIEGTVPGLYLPQVDQVGWGNFMLQFDNWSGPPPDEVFPCDPDINNLPPGQDWITICPPDGVEPGGDTLNVVFTLFDAPIPWGDPEYSYTYAAVFDADGLPNNNFQYHPPYNWDLWQNTDQWYQVDWMHTNLAWTFYALGPNWAPLESNARVVIHDNGIFWLIPADDFAVSPPGARVSSFATSGGWDPENVGGDVNGNDPTEPLTPLSIEVIPVNDPPVLDE